MTIEHLRAEIEAAKAQAMRRFEADWGTRDVGRVVRALRHAIPDSASPAAAGERARSLLQPPR